MTLLDRYIFKSVLFTCAAAVGLFAFIVLVPNIARDLLPYVLAGQLSAAAFGRLVLLLVPLAITYALPMGLLTGVLLTLGRLSADHEITAMRAAGVGLPRLTVPVLALGVMGAALGLYFNFDSMPRARVEYHRELAEAVRVNSLSFVEEKTFIRTFPGYVFYVGDKSGSELKDFWGWELDDQKRETRLVRAATGPLEYDDADEHAHPDALPCAGGGAEREEPREFFQQLADRSWRRDSNRSGCRWSASSSPAACG